MKNLNFSQLKAFAAESKIVVTGGKRKKETWLSALVENSIPTATACESPALNSAIAQLDTLRQQEDELFQRALVNPQAEMLGQFETIWNARNIIHIKMENVMTPMPTEPVSVQPQKAQEELTIPTTELAKPGKETSYTLEEFQAIPSIANWRYTGEVFKRYWVCKGATGRYSTLPQSVINCYGLTPRQVEILEEKIQITRPNVVVEPMPDGGYEDEPCWHDVAMSRTSDDYVSNREIIMGRY